MPFSQKKGRLDEIKRDQDIFTINKTKFKKLSIFEPILRFLKYFSVLRYRLPFSF